MDDCKPLFYGRTYEDGLVGREFVVMVGQCRLTLSNPR